MWFFISARYVCLGLGNRKLFWYQNTLHRWLLQFGSVQVLVQVWFATSKTELEKSLEKYSNIFQPTRFNQTMIFFKSTDLYKSNYIYINHDNCLEQMLLKILLLNLVTMCIFNVHLKDADNLIIIRSCIIGKILHFFSKCAIFCMHQDQQRRPINFELTWIILMMPPS